MIARQMSDRLSPTARALGPVEVVLAPQALVRRDTSQRERRVPGSRTRLAPFGVWG